MLISLHTSLVVFNAIFLMIVGGIPLYSMLLLAYPFMNKSMIEYIIWYVARMYFKTILWTAGFTIQVDGLHKLDKNKVYMIACNHTSFLDIPIMYSVLPFHFIPVAKTSLAYVPIFGWLLILSGCIFVDKNDTKKSIENMNIVVADLLDYPKSILIFPEGKRSDDLISFRTGGMIMSIQLGIPVVPVTITGCTRAIGREMNIDSKINKSAVIRVSFSDPLITTGLDPVIHKYALTYKVYTEIYDTLSKIIKNPIYI